MLTASAVTIRCFMAPAIVRPTRAVHTRAPANVEHGRTSHDDQLLPRVDSSTLDDEALTLARGNRANHRVAVALHRSAPMRCAPLLALAALALTASVADAEPRQRAVHGVLGMWTPVGELGAEGELMVTDHLGISAGVGAAMSGVQVAAMPRLHAPLGPHSWLAFGLGMSAGRYQWEEMCIDGSCSRYTTDLALWGNAELAIEWQRPGGFSLRAFVGAGRQLNPDAARCVNIFSGSMCPEALARDQNEMTVLPSAGVALGSTF